MKKQFTTAVLRIFTKVNNIGRIFEEVTLCGGIIVLAAFLITNVIGRKVGALIYFIDELAMFLVIFITFVGISYGVRKARHIRMAAIFDLVNEKIQKLMVLIISILSALVMFYMAYLAIIYVLYTQSMGQIAPTLRMPYWIGIVIVPLGFFLAGIQYTLMFAKNISRKEVWVSSEQQSEYEE